MAASSRPQRVDVMSPAPPQGKRSGEMSIVRDGLAALLAHDLKTPLAAISMNLDFVLAELPADTLSAPMRAALDDCRAANARAIRILSDMADAVRLQAGERTSSFNEVDMQGLLSGVVRRAAAEALARGVRLLWSADVPLVMADEDLLGRSVERLLERALRYSRVGGTIEISVRESTIAIRVRGAGPEDTRASPELAVRGLAMHFVDAAMRAQGGSVWTEQENDGSLLFCLGLPTREPEAG